MFLCILRKASNKVSSHGLQNANFSRTSIRTASVTNVRFIQSKHFIEKQVKDRYKEKLEQRAKQQGLDNAEKMMQEMKEQIEATKKELNKIDPLKELENYEQAMNLQESIKGKKQLDPISPDTPKTPFKTLESYLKLDKVKDLGTQEIEFLWRAKFQSSTQSLVAVIPNEIFQTMYKIARRNPTFVLPLPKENAQIDVNEVPGEGTPMEIHFVQWSFVGPNTVHCMITTLMEYKLHKEYARPHTTIAFHTELSDSKDIVLMNGQVEKESAMTLGESQILLLNLQRFYGAFRTGSEIEKERLALLEAFNHGSSIFSMDECIRLSQIMDN